MNQLYLLRHGIALPRGTPDMNDEDRPLTPDGQRRVRDVARGLKRIGLEVDRIATSPLSRARSTAEIVAQVLDEPELVEVVDDLRADREATTIRSWLSERPETRLMIVGHNPNLSDLLALLTTGDQSRKFCELRKGGVAALIGEPGERYRVDWIARPKLFRL